MSAGAKIPRMTEIQLLKTIDRSILGSLNEAKFQVTAQVQYGRCDLSPLAMSLFLSRLISLVLPDGYPRDAALRALGQDPRKPALKLVR